MEFFTFFQNVGFYQSPRVFRKMGYFCILKTSVVYRGVVIVATRRKVPIFIAAFFRLELNFVYQGVITQRVNVSIRLPRERR